MRVVVLQAGQSAGMTPEQAQHFLAASKSQQVKDRLKQHTQEALELGVRTASPLTSSS